MRIVSLTCSNTEIVAALGLGAHLVGVDDHSDWPVEAVQQATRVGPDLQIDLDRVAALRPDLVLGSLTVPGHERIVEGLVARGLPHLAPEPKVLADVARDVRDIAAALGVSARGEAVAAELEAAFLVSESVQGPKVLVEWWPKPVYVPGSQSWVTELTRCAGGVNPFADRPVKSFALTAEEAVSAQIDAIVISWCGVPRDKYRASVVLDRPGWKDVPAVRAGNVFPIAECFLGRPGPRLIHGLAALREVVTAVSPP